MRRQNRRAGPPAGGDALHYAAQLISARPMTRKMLVDKLRAKGFTEDETDAAAEKLEEAGALDDALYARLYVENEAAAGHGRIRVMRELMRRGVAREEAETALETLPDPEAAIRAFIEARLRGGAADRREARRIAEALMRRGYGWEDISPVLDGYVEEK